LLHTTLGNVISNFNNIPIFSIISIKQQNIPTILSVLRHTLQPLSTVHFDSSMEFVCATSSDVNKDWTCKDKDKDQDKNKD